MIVISNMAYAVLAKEYFDLGLQYNGIVMIVQVQCNNNVLCKVTSGQLFATFMRNDI